MARKLGGENKNQKKIGRRCCMYIVHARRCAPRNVRILHCRRRVLRAAAPSLPLRVAAGWLMG